MILIEMELLNRMLSLTCSIHYVSISSTRTVTIDEILVGFNLSPSTLETIVSRYSTRIDENSSTKVSFEHYVQLCARLTLLHG